MLLSNTNLNSLQGLGDNRGMQDPAMIALGDSWYFSGQTNGVAIMSTSTFWRSKFSQLRRDIAKLLTQVNKKQLNKRK